MDCGNVLSGSQILNAHVQEFRPAVAIARECRVIYLENAQRLVVEDPHWIRAGLEKHHSLYPVDPVDHIAASCSRFTCAATPLCELHRAVIVHMRLPDIRASRSKAW